MELPDEPGKSLDHSSVVHMVKSAFVDFLNTRYSDQSQYWLMICRLQEFVPPEAGFRFHKDLGFFTQADALVLPLLAFEQTRCRPILRSFRKLGRMGILQTLRNWREFIGEIYYALQ